MVSIVVGDSNEHISYVVCILLGDSNERMSCFLVVLNNFNKCPNRLIILKQICFECWFFYFCFDLENQMAKYW